MGTIQIVSRWDSSRVLWSGEADSMRHAVEQAAKARANLAGADLAGADLAGADLAGANLAGANLAGAKGVGDWMAAIRADVHEVLHAAPAEVPGLLAALRAGKVDGSTYSGECACLVGTLERGASLRVGASVSLPHNPDRPAERWFLRIRAGDTPSTNMHAASAAIWIQEWLDKREATNA